MDTALLILALLVAGLVVCFLAALAAAVIIVRLTGSSTCLRDLAVLVRAFGLSKLADAVHSAASRQPDH